MDYIRTLIHNTHATGWHTLLVECDRDGVLENLELQYNHSPTEVELITAVTDYGEATRYDTIQSVEMDLKSNKELLIEMLKYIRDHPALTLTQFNNALGTKIWYEQYTAKFFLWKLAVGLSQKYNVNIEGLTEAQIFVKIRNWLVDTPIKKIAKIVFGEVFEM